MGPEAWEGRRLHKSVCDDGGGHGEMICSMLGVLRLVCLRGYVK
jgi:hypothetical protein